MRIKVDIREFFPYYEAVDLDSENFYCIILVDPELWGHFTAIQSAFVAAHEEIAELVTKANKG